MTPDMADPGNARSHACEPASSGSPAGGLDSIEQTWEHTPMSTYESTVPQAMIAPIRARLAAFNAKMQKRGIPGTAQVDFANARMLKITDYVQEMIVDATLTLPPLVTEHGWRFVAALDHLPGAVVTRSIPGSDISIPSWAHDVEPGRCDHCRTDRRRNTSYLIVREGTFQIVGSSCIDDFMGHSATGILSLSDDITSMLADDDKAPRQRFATVADVLRAASDVTAMAGRYVRSGEDGATINTVRDIIFGGRMSREFRREFDADPRYATMSARILDETMAGIADMRDDGEWAHNIITIARAGMVNLDKHLAIFASAVTIGLRRVRATEERKVRANEFIGAQGAKVVLDATCTGIRLIESYYGTSTLYTFTTPEGNLLKWFASKDQGLVENGAVRVSGTVKAHETFNGRNSTLLTRCKVERI